MQPQQQAVAELGDSRVKLVTEGGRVTLHLAQLVRGPVGCDARTLHGKQADANIDLRNRPVAVDLLLRVQRVPHGCLGGGINQGRDDGGFTFLLECHDVTLTHRASDEAADDQREQQRNEQQDARENACGVLSVDQEILKVIEPIHASKLRMNWRIAPTPRPDSGDVQIAAITQIWP